MAAYLSGDPERQKSAFIADRLGCEGTQGASGQMRRFPATSAFAFLGSRGLAAMREGLFRGQGEVHQWMYDRFSMARALRQSGFASVRKCQAGESDIPNFARDRLEILDGRERKPDSVYMEGRKPAPSGCPFAWRACARGS